MSLAYYMVAETDIEGLDLFVDGKALAHADQQRLSALCEALKVRDLMDFVSIGTDELEDLFDDGAAPDELPDEQWFTAAEGLACVRALRERLRSGPGDLHDTEAVAEDLEAMESALVKLEQQGVRWHLAIDY